MNGRISVGASWFVIHGLSAVLWAAIFAAVLP